MKNILITFLALFSGAVIFAQTTVTGTVTDSQTNDPIPGVNIKVVGHTTGTSTDFDGKFTLKTTADLPFSLEFTYVGFKIKVVQVTSDDENISVSLEEMQSVLDEVVVSASRTPESIRESPVSIERMDIRAIRETASADFYDAIENLKGVRLNTNSLTFKSVNTRGFATFANSRFVQLVDGMDSAAPALNFVMGNLTGMSELDVHSIELLPGASSALYGANAFNGILFMTSKNPFDYQGVSVYLKGGMTIQDAAGDNGYYDFGMRFAYAFSDKFAAKASFSMLSGTDWIAANYDDLGNPGATRTNPGYNGLNVYGDEVATTLNFDQIAADAGIVLPPGFLGAARVSRTGYLDREIIDYDAESFKADAAFHYRPTGGDLEIILQGKVGVGTTVYQGANRYYLKDFKMNMVKLEVRSKDFFVRFYRVEDNAGKSMDSRFAAININRRWKSDTDWFTQYAQTYIGGRLGAIPGLPALDENAAHALARQQAQTGRFEPGSPEFKAAKKDVANDPSFITGAQFLDNSKVYQGEGNYNFSSLLDNWADIQIGGNYRQYQLVSQGTIFTDVDGPIKYNEYGIYTQFSKKLIDDRLKFTASIRYDKNELMDGNFSPRVSLVYSAGESRRHNFRASFQSGFRNPTTQDFFIGLDVGNAFLVGGAPGNAEVYNTRPQLVSPTGQFLGYGNNIVINGRQGYDNAWTLASLQAFGASAAAGAPDPSLLEKAVTDYVEPEKITAYELGYRGSIGRFSFDISGYWNQYKNFLANRLVIVPLYGQVDLSDAHPVLGIPNALIAIGNGDYKPFQMYTNTDADISSYGVLLGVNAKVFNNYNLGFNYTYSGFDFKEESDPGFRPGFNTPENAIKVSFGNPNLFKNFGFNVSYRWNDEYLWQASFGDGIVDAASVFDAQINYTVPGILSTFKVGATNLGGKEYTQAIGTGFIGSQYYLSWTINP